MDKSYARLTYIDAPKPTGLLKMIPKGGDYKKALALTPGESTFILAGQVDTVALTDMIGRMMAASSLSDFVESETRPAQSAPASKSAGDTMPQKVLDQIKALAEASDGNVGLFASDLQSVVAGEGQEFPIGMVVGLKDQAKALAAVKELKKLSGQNRDGGDEMSEEGPDGAALKQYRKIDIQNIKGPLRIAVLKDCMVIALGDSALKSAMDANMDKAGGLADDSKAKKILDSCGQGAVAFVIDLPGLAKLLWPMLISATTSEDIGLPIASPPSTDKMVRMLGPEAAVIQRDDGGLLLRSRGKVPFATKVSLFGLSFILDRF